jgi:hypothetical protein
MCSIALAQDDNLIVPGERLGPVRIGEFMEDVLKKLGKPDRIVRNDSAHYLDYYYDRLGITFGKFTSLADIAPQIQTVSTFSNRYETDKGIRVGSSGMDVVKAYGRDVTCLNEAGPDNPYGTGPYFGVWYFNLGVNFFIWKNTDSVFLITVYRPNPNKNRQDVCP